MGNLGTEELGNWGTWELGTLGSRELGTTWTWETNLETRMVDEDEPSDLRRLDTLVRNRCAQHEAMDHPSTNLTKMMMLATINTPLLKARTQGSSKPFQARPASSSESSQPFTFVLVSISFGFFCCCCLSLPPKPSNWEQGLKTRVGVASWGVGSLALLVLCVAVQIGLPCILAPWPLASKNTGVPKQAASPAAYTSKTVTAYRCP